MIELPIQEGALIITCDDGYSEELDRATHVVTYEGIVEEYDTAAGTIVMDDGTTGDELQERIESSAAVEISYP